MGMLELSQGDSVEYLSKTFNESRVELLRESVNDIHKTSSA